ncbi:MAG: hypothetical protein QW091_01990 [Candidatus Micrarchaeaceae archaeon]
MALSSKNLFFMLVLISFVFVLLIYLLYLPTYVKIIFAIIALAIDVMAFSTKYYTYLFIPLLHAKNKTVVLSPDPAFRISPNGNAIIVRSEGLFYVSAFVKIPFYKSATEMTEDERTDFARSFSKMLTISKEPVKFTTLLYVINKDEYINEIRQKLDLAEAAYASLNAQANPAQTTPQLERAKGEVTMWRNLLDSISRVRSNALGSYAMVTATGATEEEATTIAMQKADELAAGISATLGVSAYIMESKEFIAMIEPEEMIPFATISEQMQEKTASLGV